MEEYRRWEDNIKMCLKEIGFDVMNWMELSITVYRYLKLSILLYFY